MKKAFMLGICSSFFFAFTFILNQQMHLSGGSWYWSSSLRYIFMLPMLLIIMISKRQLKEVIIDIRKKAFIMAFVEYYRIWLFLCSFKFCFILWCIMACGWNMAIDNSSWWSYVTIIL